MTKKPYNQNGAVKHMQRLKKLMNYAVRIDALSKNPINSFRVGYKPYYRQIRNWDDLNELKSVKLPTKGF